MQRPTNVLILAAVEFLHLSEIQFLSTYYLQYFPAMKTVNMLNHVLTPSFEGR